MRRASLLLLLCLAPTVGFGQSLSPSTLPNGTAGVAYSQNLTASGIGTVSYCTIVSGQWPIFMSDSGTGIGCNIYSSNPQQMTFTFTIMANGSGGQAYGTYTLSFTTPLAVTTSSLPGGLQGSAYSQTLGASGGTGSGYSWSLYSGSLPTGLSLSTAGVISGTPSAAGTFNFTVKVTDSGSNTATKALSIAVTSSLAITTSSLPGGYVGASYSASLAASGGTPPYSWTVISGSFPPGLTLASGGSISGAPTTAGTYSFTVKCTDSGSGSATAALSISVGSSITISTTTLPNGLVNSAYAASITATGGSGSYTGWSISSGADPPGISYGSTSSNPLSLSGTPTTAGTYNVTWKNCDAVTSQCASQAYSITIGAALSVNTSSLANGTYNVGYSQSLSASGGTAPYTWSIVSGSLPNGLSLSGATISGTPTATGTWNFTVQATDSTSPTHQTATKALSIHMIGLPTVGIDGIEVYFGASGEPGAIGTSTAYYSSTPQVFGPAYAFTYWALGPDATISSLTIKLDGSQIATPTWGTVSRQDACNWVGGGSWPGCPNVGFSFAFPASSYSLGAHTLVISATDTNGNTGTASFPITILSTMSVTTSALTNALVNSPYSQSLAATGGSASYTWSIASGSLPPGLTLSGGGTISGTATAAGTYNLTVQATDTAYPTNQTATKALSILVNSVLSISASSLPNGLATTAYSQNLTATGGTPSYSWSLSSGSLPSGLSLNTSGNIFGTPTTAGTSNFTVKVTDNTTPTQQSGTKALSISIGAALSITTTSLPNGLATASYSQPLAATGGTSPYTWALSSGTLPPGLSLSTGGTISGTPATGGTYNFAVTATDSTSPTAQTATQNLSIMITPAFSISTTTLPGGVASAAYSQALAGSGGTPPYSWTITAGNLPPGLTLSTGGTISGTPTAAGTYNFTVKGSDSSPTAQTATQPLSIAIGAALTITTTSVPNALANTGYSQPLTATGGATPYSWTISAGTLPSGLALTSSGAIYGTPNVAGTFSFTAQVTDSTAPSAEVVSKSLSLTVGPALSITNSSLPGATVGTAYSQTLAATGGTPSYTWSVASGNLPPGLTLSAAGAISGTPTTAGLYNFVVKASDTTSPTPQTAAQALGINILAVLAITTSSLPSGLATTAYSQVLGASGGTPPYTWSVTSGSLPPGLTLSASGVLSGTPTTAGSSIFTFKATDVTTPTAMTASQSYTVTVGPAIAITTATLPNGLAGSPYGQVLAASGGTMPYTWSLASGTLPAGLSLTPGGAISGIANAAGTSSFSVKATDSTSPTPQATTKPLSITITPGLTITTTSLANGLATTPYSKTLAASGGTTPYAWTITSGALPSGLTISSGGVISGTPTVSGTFSFVIQATDSTSPNAQTASQALSVSLGGALTITTQSLNAATALQSYSQTVSGTGGTPPYTWSLVSGSLPAGIALNGNTLSGTPTSAGTSTFTLQATDSTTPTAETATASLSLTVEAAFAITTASPLANGLGGTAYITKIKASGGTAPYTFTLASGSPPAGLTLESDGTLFGTPTAAGTSLFSVLASDSTTPTAQTQIKPFSLTITPPLSITTNSLPAGIVGSAYSQTISATGGTAPYTWTVSSGNLPPGLTLSSTGSIEGTPTVAQLATFTVQVTDGTSPTPQSATIPLSISVSPQLTITTSSLPPAVFGSTYNTQLTATGGTSPYRWAIIGGNLPPGLSLSQSGYITGTCTSSGEYTITVQVSDTTSPIPQTATRVLTVDGNTSLSITTGSLTPAQIQQPYTTSFTAAGGVPPYAWSVVSGSLPAGLTLAPSGTVSGTPTAAGTSTFSVQVADSSGNLATRAFNLTVPAPLTIATTTLQPAITGSTYITSVSATGGSTPYVWSIASGALPPGLSLSSTGIISGSPTLAGNATFTVQVAENSQPVPQSATKSLSISVTSPLTITTTSLPLALTNTAYSQSLSANGGTAPYTWSLASGQLPAGLTLNASGTVSGTPTTKGITNFTIQVTDSSSPTQSASQSYILNVVAPFSITTASLPAGEVGHGYNSSLSATGGQSPYTWTTTTGSLPAGLSLSSSGTISGTPTTAGLASFTVQATDSLSPGAETATQVLSINVTAPLTISTTSLPSGVVGIAYNQTLGASGGTSPYTWSLASGQLPAGISLGPSGSLSGTPTAAGTFNVIVQAADSGSQTATQSLALAIVSGLSIATTTLPDGSLNQPYNAAVTATGGITPYTWTLSTGTLPPGLTIASDGRISGTPTVAGAALFTLQVADSASPIPDTATQSYTVHISAPLTITTTSLASGITNVPYTQTLDATGGTTPYTWSLLSGSLPVGLTLNANGTISGTPTTPGGATITVQIMDGATQGTQTATQEYTLSITAALSITTTALPSGLQNVAYPTQTLAAANGTQPYTWSLASGQLPGGLILAANGTISGTPTAPGSATFTVQASDSSQPAQTATRSLTITVNPPLAITTTTLPNPKDGATYSQTLSAIGGTTPYAWSLASGSLPTGLVLTPDGTISGTATGPGTFPFTVQVTDATQPTPETAQANFNLQTIVSFQITTGTIPPGIVGVAYSTTFAASGGTTPYTWITGGTLPPGLNLSYAGTLAGTPSAPGTYSFTIQVTDSASPNRSSAATFNVQIQPPLTITTAQLSDTTIGATYQAALTATGGTTPYSWSISTGSLPNGLTLKSDGTVSGIAISAGTSTFTVQVTDASQATAQTASRTYIVNVTIGLSIANNSLPDSYLTNPYTLQFNAIGGLGPYTWSATGIPPGLSLTTNGSLSGTPTTTGTYTLNVSVIDAYTPPHSASKPLAMSVRAGLNITTTTLPDGQVGAAYSQTLAALFGTQPYLWNIGTGSLPPGLSISAGGTISGTPTAPGGYNFTVSLSDSSLPPLTATAELSITIDSGLTITTNSLPATSPATGYSATLQATGGTTPYMWSLATGTLPPGLVLATDGTIVGTPTANGTYSITVQVADSGTPRLTATRLFSIPVGPSLLINTPSLPDAQIGTSYHQTPTALNGTQPYYWTLQAGALPPGLILLASGDIVGQPSVAGTATFTISVSDNEQPPVSASHSYTLNVNPGFAITTLTLPEGTPGVPYLATLTAADGTPPFTWSVVLGPLAPRLTLNSKTGLISGTPTTAGIYDLLIQATDSSSPAQTATAQFTLRIDSSLQITTATLPDAITGKPYYQALSATNGIQPFAWSLASAAPPGLTLLPSGETYGIPTVPGQYKITIAVSDASQPTAHASRDLMLLVTQPLTITTNTVPPALTSKPYATVVIAAGGTPPYSFTAQGQFPPGLTLAQIGTVIGTPTLAGTYPVTIQVIDAVQGSATAPVVFVVGPVLAITRMALPTGQTGSTYFDTLTAIGGSGLYTWSLTSGDLPPGVNFIASLGAFVGTPILSGQYPIQVAVTDGQQTATASLTITITDPLSIPPQILPPAQQSLPYSTTLKAAGGVSPYTWALSNSSTPPTGMSLSSLGVLAGHTSAAPGVFPLSLCVTDHASPPARVCGTLSLVLGPAFRITTATLPCVAPGQAISVQLAAAGAEGTVTWTPAFALPTGLTLSSDGLLSGTPTTAGTYDLTIIASDTANEFAVTDLTLLVLPPLTIQNAALPAGTVAVPYVAGLLAASGQPPYSWSADPATLPTGFTLDPSGILYGSPAKPLSSTVSITVTDSSTPPQAATSKLALSIQGALTITTTELPDPVASSPYSAGLTANGVQPLQWALLSGQLPAGLTFHVDGTISGIASSPGPTRFVVSVIDGNGRTAAAPFTLMVDSGLGLPTTPTALPNATVGTPYTYTVHSSFNGTVAWTLDVGTLPPGISLTPDGILSGTPTAPCTASFMLQASAAGQTATETFTLTVAPQTVTPVPAPTIPPASTQLPTGNVNQPYAAPLTATGGTQPYAWALTQGQLPGGLALNPLGTISGSPTEGGSYSFALTATDANNQTATALFSLTIIAPLTITSPTTLNAHVGTPTTFNLTATGGTAPYTWSATTALPAGLILNPSGTLTGTPAAAANASITVTVHDSSSATQPATATATLQINIAAGLTITTATLAVAAHNSPYNASLTAQGGTTPYTWKITDGQLPTGLTLSAAGALSGTPTTLGSYRFALTVTDASGQAASASFVLTIADPLSITTIGPFTVTLGQPAAVTLSATGGTQPYTWSVTSGNLPAGLTLSPTGIISGTPTAASTATITIAVHDSAQPPASISITLSITASATLAITTTSLPPVYQNSPYTATLVATGGTAPYTWSLASGQLPAGLFLAPSGLITGKPNSTGTAAFKVTVTDASQQTATATLSCTVQSLAIATTSLPPATVGTPYTAALSATGGTPPYSWSSTSTLPGGLIFTVDGVLTGTPAAPYAQSLTFTVTDQTSATSSATLPLTVTNLSLPQLAITGLPAQISPATQTTLTIALPQPAPIALAGSLSIQFTPDVTGRDDASLAFVPANSRTLAFTLTAGATTPHFVQSPTLQAGTSSGVITITAEIDNTRSATATASTRIPQLAPVITAARILSHDQFSLTLELNGYSTTASVSSAHFSFPGLSQPDLTLDVTALFNTWYLSQPAINQGGTFQYTQTLNFSGDSSNLLSINASLTNSIGTSLPYSLEVK